MVQVKPKRPDSLSKWLEEVVFLPAGLAAVPGLLKLHPYQRAIADAIADPKIERVSVLKSARIGYTTVLVGAIAHYIVRDPSPILVLMPTESDCRGLMVDDIEQLFQESPALREHLPMPHPGKSDRHTLLHRLFKGGSLKVVAAGAPRNMRRHSAKVLLIDEVDACAVTAEGDAVSLATQRTLIWPRRKIVAGGTPFDASTSVIARLYGESDRRVWELPCPACGAFSEISWEAIEWPTGRPEEAAWRCPECEELIEERHKPAMARRGRWHVTNPTAGARHAGFKINALSSLLPNAAWGRLAAEYVQAKEDPATLKVFVNTVLGLPWSEQGDGIDETALARRIEPIGLDAIPEECLALSAGTDCADDRLETVICGWTRDNVCLVLDHIVIWGAIGDDLTWQQLDQLLRRQFSHPLGGKLRIEACAIDFGDGGHADIVLGFAAPRASRRVMAIKGAPGFSRRALQASSSKMKRGRLWICGVDSLKSRLFDQLQRPGTIRFSDQLEPVYFEQLSSEKRVTRTVRGKPTARFERIRGMKAEALDATIYALAARVRLGLSDAMFDQRAAQLRKPEPTTPVAPPLASTEPPRPDSWLIPGQGNPWSNERTTDGWLDTDRDDWIR